MNIAALDPGRDKCGFAVLSEAGTILCQRVIETNNLIHEIDAAKADYGFSRLIMGNGTTSKIAQQRLASVAGLEILVRDEYRTTEMARGEYWKAHPPTGWRRLLPVTMQVPPVPVDDFVAVILARRFLEEQQERKGE
ncbi:RNase H-fold protein, predicted Holliday junction resolvase [Selenomonas ruminantium]|uniref:RNase H-fold protein, predicted Holliday junction resolvase n=1 Tax=Selenomonas ruminantium TaxID=971 RepID=A0A1M6TTH6_SELRU|nr:resolvase [Selenomonas ruminantium]SHK60229.1 RNase H-fold protein, predicted Holliday junction resolvase [Selenomonas ruminantium]